MRLSDVLGAVRAPVGDLVATSDPEISDVVLDSRRVTPGALFACLPGGRVDGHQFAAQAVEAGAAALLVEHRLDLPVAQIVSPDSRQALGHLAAAFHGHPSDRLVLVGVTGTNGKTTTTSLIATVLRSAGWRTGLIGTLSGVHTTPEAPDLQRLLADMVADGHRAVVMEVSSHALALHRVNGCRFALAVFTNLSQDHLDLHGTMERYFAAKALLFTPLLSERALVNRDDLYGRLLLDAAEIPTDTFGTDDIDDVEASTTDHHYRWHGHEVRVGLGGRFNVENSLAAAESCRLLGIDPAVVASGLAEAPVVPGRMEPVLAGQAFDILVDYAHTPDGLHEVLAAVRAGLADDGRRVLVVFGCGGDRDRDKRAEMGRVAGEWADVVVITSDNPRSEDPLQIIAAVRSGVPAHYGGRLVIEADRRTAIGLALAEARPGDVVVIAGKGHETTQTIGSDVLPFDDRTVVRELLEDQT